MADENALRDSAINRLHVAIERIHGKPTQPWPADQSTVIGTLFGNPTALNSSGVGIAPSRQAGHIVIGVNIPPANRASFQAGVAAAGGEMFPDSELGRDFTNDIRIPIATYNRLMQ